MSKTHRQTLIDCMRQTGLGQSEIARRIGIDPAQLSRVIHGTESLSPELAALLAAVCNRDPTEALKRQAIDNAKEPRRTLLNEALFHWLPKTDRRRRAPGRSRLR